jgi:hypothetical protein
VKLFTHQFDLANAFDQTTLVPPGEDYKGFGGNFETFYFINHLRGHLWVSLGFSKLIKNQQTSSIALAYLQDNLQGVKNIVESALKRKSDCIDQHLEYQYHLDGFIDIASGDIEVNFDDVLLTALQIYFSSFPTTINKNALNEMIDLLEAMK